MKTNAHGKSRLSRRLILAGGLATAGGSAVFATTWFNVLADASAEGALTVEDANRLATEGQIYLVDIRRPDE